MPNEVGNNGTSIASVASSLGDLPSLRKMASSRTRLILAATEVLLVVLPSAIVGTVMATRPKGNAETYAETKKNMDVNIMLDAASETLSLIRKRGYINCGVTLQQGYAWINAQGIWEGFEVDLCRAVAAGIFGKDGFDAAREAEPVEFVKLEAGDRFSTLNLQASTQKGYTFSTPLPCERTCIRR
jgi:ABC-type amino acid transport substrate-binding protein